MRSPLYGDSGSEADYEDDFPLDEDDSKYPLEPASRHRPAAPSPPPPAAIRAESPAAAAAAVSVSASHPSILSSTPQTIPSFQCQLDSIAPLLDMLTALQIDKQHSSSAFQSSSSSSSASPLLLHVSVLPQGLKLTVNRSKVLSANGYLKSNLFSEWMLKEAAAEYRFTVSLSRLLQVLSVFSSSAHLVLSFEQEDDRLRMEMEQDGSICECQLACVVSTTESADDQQLHFASAPVIVRASLKSHVLRACLSDLELSGSQHFSLIVQPVAPRLRLAVFTEGVSVITAIVPHPSHSPAAAGDEFVDFQYSPAAASVRFEYPCYLLPPSLTVLALAEHTNLRINASGMLSMQHVINTRIAGVTNWLEFVCTAMEEGMDGDAAARRQAWGDRLFPVDEIQLE